MPAARTRLSQAELRALALAAIALALLGIVGLASGASAWRATHAALGAPEAALRAVAAIGGVVLALALLLVWAGTPKVPRRKRKGRTIAGDDFEELGESLWTAGKTVAVVLLALALFCLAALPFLSRPSAPPPFGGATRPPASTGPVRSETGRAGHSFNLGWLVIPMALTLGALAPAAFLIRRRRRHGTAAEDTSALQQAVQASIAALESERDPRRAILRAYRRMEQAFEKVEIVRSRDETASEFLGRVMRRLRVSTDSATELTERFEEARFSTHTLTEDDRELALGSLHRVERELATRP
jgi:membrane protease YdiL (CAAX protease family)